MLLVVGLSLGEIGLRIAAWWMPFVDYQLAQPWTRNRIPDPKLGYRVSPYFPGHDRQGYRNADVPSQVDVLAIGDSMTYGFGASAEQAWPQRLQAKSGRVVYNAGVGGYGPCEYGIVLQELLRLAPKVVVLAVTVGNDLSDAYISVFHGHRCPDLALASPEASAALAAADQQQPFPSAPGVGPNAAPPDTGYKRLALYRLVRSVRHQLATSSRLPFREYMDDTFDAASRRPGRIPLEAPPAFRTVFLDPRVLSAFVDTSEIRIQEGLRITLHRFDQMNAELQKRGIKFVVVLLRDKPFVMRPVVERERPDTWARLAPLVSLEDRTVALLSQWLEERRIDHLEAGTAMQQTSAGGRMLFPESDDHHPNGQGYDVIAETVMQFLRSRN